MTARAPLPPDLGLSFSVHDARRAGISRKRLLAADLHAEFHGGRSRVADRRRALVPLMSATQAFCGPTAAAIWELPLPARWAADPSLHVATTKRAVMRRPGVVASCRPGAVIVLADGVPVLDPVSTWFSLGATLSRWDLVAVADRLISGTLTERALSSMDAISRRLDGSPRFVGMSFIRLALADARVGSWSRPESLLRILLIRAGFPEPALNRPVRLPGGRVVYPDLSWPELRIALEYDGRWHRESTQYGLDAGRHERLVDAGWMVVRITASDLFGHPAALLSRLRMRLAARGAVVRVVPAARMPRFEP